jgi:pyridoxal phosphate enzyme (YggS family)
MTTLSTLESRYRAVMDRVAQAAERSGRTASDIFVVAVTKYAEIEDIRELIKLGHEDFGENRVQQLIQRAGVIEEMLSRHRTMKGVAAERRTLLARDEGAESTTTLPEHVRWHMIGHLQRNKVSKVAPLVRLIHSVDSLRLVEELQGYAVKRDLDIDVLVQVNVSEEESKFGCAVAAAPHLCDQIDATGNLHIRGLMTIAEQSEDPEDSRICFSRCAEIFEDIERRDIGDGRFNILSMGMSGDFEVAIECGANVVRVGSAIFGVRELSEDEA